MPSSTSTARSCRDGRRCLLTVHRPTVSTSRDDLRNVVGFGQLLYGFTSVSSWSYGCLRQFHRATAAAMIVAQTAMIGIQSTNVDGAR